MSLNSDVLLSVTGLFPDTITPKQHVASMGIAEIWTKRLTSWVRNEDPKPFEYVEQKDVDKLFDKLAKPPVELEVEGWFQGVGDDVPGLQGEFFAGLTNSRAYLVNAWPSFNVDSASGPKTLPLSYDDAAEMWSLIQVLDDPDRVLDEMDSRTLTPSQALAFRENFPDLYAHANEVLDTALIDKRSKNDDFDLGWERESVLNTFRGKPPEEPIKAPPPPPAPDQKLKIDPERTETQADVSAAPKKRK